MPVLSQITQEEERAIVTAARLHLHRLGTMPGATILVEALFTGHARVRVTPRAGVPAWVYVRHEPGAWVVIAGPAPSFTHDQLEALGIPPELWPR